MANNNKNEQPYQSPLWRKLVILAIAFILLGTTIFLPLASGKNRNDIFLWVSVGIYLALLIIAFVTIIYKHLKDKNNTK